MKSVLTKHIAKHTGEECLGCNFCSENARKIDHNRHIMEHAGDNCLNPVVKLFRLKIVTI